MERNDRATPRPGFGPGGTQPAAEISNFDQPVAVIQGSNTAATLTQREVADVIDTLDELIDSEGVHAALAFLNSRSPHRFTGVYRLDPPTLRNVRLYDRENPELEMGADTPLRETYCFITGSTAAPFYTADARADARLGDHPARDSVLSYCGVPLLDESGAAVGTLCHFDLAPRPIPTREIAVLSAAAPRILDALRRGGLFRAG